MSLCGRNLGTLEIKKIVESEDGIFLLPLSAHFVGNMHNARLSKEPALNTMTRGTVVVQA